MSTTFSSSSSSVDIIFLPPLFLPVTAALSAYLHPPGPCPSRPLRLVSLAHTAIGDLLSVHFLSLCSSSVFVRWLMFEVVSWCFLFHVRVHVKVV